MPQTKLPKRVDVGITLLTAQELQMFVLFQQEDQFVFCVLSKKVNIHLSVCPVNMIVVQKGPFALLFQLAFPQVCKGIMMVLANGEVSTNQMQITINDWIPVDKS